MFAQLYSFLPHLGRFISTSILQGWRLPINILGFCVEKGFPGTLRQNDELIRYYLNHSKTYCLLYGLLPKILQQPHNQ